MSGRYEWRVVDAYTRELVDPSGDVLFGYEGPAPNKSDLIDHLNWLAERKEQAQVTAENLRQQLRTYGGSFESERQVLHRRIVELEAAWKLAESDGKAAEARAEKAETALDEAIARADNKASNALIRTTAALRETIIRAEKAEARVAELRTMLDEATDRSDLHFNNLSRTLANQRDEKQAHALTVAKLQARVAELERDGAALTPDWCYREEEQTLAPVRFICMKCSWGWDDSGTAKPAPETPVPAPEGTETAQNQAPVAGTGPSRHDQASRGVAAGVEPAPVLGDSRGSGPLTWIELFRLGTAHDRCGGCGKVGSDRFNATCPACKIAFPHNSLAVGGKCNPLIACPICTGRIPDPSGPYPTPEADAFRVYDEMLRNPGVSDPVPPRRATTCWDVKCPCVEEHGPVTLTDEDRVDLTKPQTLRAWATFGEASPENSIRITVDPAAAAEVEARTNAVATDTLRAYVTWGPASPENMLTFTTPDVWIVTPPRAGLPSRDEVAAFLEARWPR